MGRSKIALLALVALLLTMLACNATLPQAETTSIPTIVDDASAEFPKTEDDVPRVTVDQAKAALDSGLAVLVDVRSVDAYTASHADGAISIPLDEFENNIDAVPLEKDQWVITYCT